MWKSLNLKHLLYIDTGTNSINISHVYLNKCMHMHIKTIFLLAHAFTPWVSARKIIIQSGN